MSVARPTEAAVQRQILDWLALKGFPAVRVNSGGVAAANRDGGTRFVRFNDTPGCADILACVGGTFTAIEVKRAGAKTDPARLAKQEAFLAWVRKGGGIAVMAESLADVERAITEAIQGGQSDG